MVRAADCPAPEMTARPPFFAGAAAAGAIWLCACGTDVAAGVAAPAGFDGAGVLPLAGTVGAQAASADIAAPSATSRMNRRLVIRPLKDPALSAPRGRDHMTVNTTVAI